MTDVILNKKKMYFLTFKLFQVFYLYAYLWSGAQWGQKRILDPVELELQNAVSYLT